MIDTSQIDSVRANGLSSKNFPKEVQQHYRGILRQLGWPQSDIRPAPQAIGITSSGIGQGATTVACQLAATAATMGKHRVLLVDAHMARPGVAQRFGIQAVTGFADIVSNGKADGMGALPCDTKGLWIVPAGSGGSNSEQVYDSLALPGFVDEAKSEFDLVVFDLPPAGAAFAPLRLAELMDGVLLVVEANRGSWEDARRIRDFFSQSKVRLVGTVLNGYQG
jgi:Mrp family chromosome partitioning ATPase